jgi:hypothetical protein
MVKSISRRKAIGLLALSPFVLGNCAHLVTKPRKALSLRKLDVPAVWGFDLKGCTAYIIKGISDYYGLNKSIGEINKGLKKGFWEHSYVTNCAALLSELGLNVDFYYFVKKQAKSETQDQNDDRMITVDELPERGIRVRNKHLPLEKITSEIDEGDPSIIYVDSKTLMGFPKRGSYTGHVIAAKGYDEDHLYLNDTSKVFGERKVKKDIFEKARRNLPYEMAITLSKKGSSKP